MSKKTPTPIKLHPRARQLSGLQSGRLLVLFPSRIDSDNHVMWRCQCACGNQKDIASNSLTRANPVKSCGCMNKTTAQKKKRQDGAWNESKSYSIKDGKHCYKQRHAWAKAAIRERGNKCEICGWSKARCDVHHLVPKAEGGLHTIENALVLCPNCHRELHTGTNK